jgi:two-component system, LytTR family, response regulator
VKRLRAIVADDEPLAVRRLVAALAKMERVALVGEATDGAEALALIAREKPDLAILDIAMPGLSGIDVIEAIDAQSPPAVIFVSAHRQYALDAFRTGAVDYLLKPLDRERFEQAVRRAETALDSRTAHQRLEELGRAVDALRAEEARRAAADTDNAFWVTAKGRVERVPLSVVLWFASDGDYVRINTAEGEYFISDSLRNLESCLDPGEFVRVHRQAIVRISAIVEVRRGRVGLDMIRLTSSDWIRVGRAYRPHIRKLLDNMTGHPSKPGAANS